MSSMIGSSEVENMFLQLLSHERAQRASLLEALSILGEAVNSDNKTKESDFLKRASDFVASQAGEQKEKSIPIVSLSYFGQIDDQKLNARLNEEESKFGEEMSQSELERLFGEKPKTPKNGEIDMDQKEPFKGMSLDEISSWEAKQDQSNDIYKVKSRVVNLAREGGASLTPVGEAMVNTFVHVLKDLYDFAETIQDKETKIKLVEKIRKHESAPGNLIKVVGSGARS